MVQAAQRLAEGPAAADFINSFMELRIQVPQLLQIALGGVEFLKLQNITQGFGFFFCDMLRGPTGSKAFQLHADIVNITKVLFADTDDHSAFVGGQLYQPFLFQPVDGLPNRGAANAETGGNAQFRQILSGF